jgi:carboxyl-terminal processing protease
MTPGTQDMFTPKSLLKSLFSSVLTTFTLACHFSIAADSAMPTPTASPKPEGHLPQLLKPLPAEEATALIDEVWQRVTKNYVDKDFNQKDWSALHQKLLNRTYRNRQELYEELRRSLKELGDRYTRFMDPQELSAMYSNSELAGIGLRMASQANSQGMAIIEALPNSPASKAGLFGGDIIVSIDGKPTQAQSLLDVSARLREPAGSIVKLEIQRGERRLSLQIPRAKIEIVSLRYQSQMEAMGKIGYIRISQLDSRIAEQSRQAILDLEKEGVIGYVFDLRGNPGGLFQASIEITRQWLNQGNIFTLKSRDSKVETTVANQTALSSKPLAILVDNNTAAGAEIIAAALQENDRAHIIGQPTFGMNTIGSVMTLQADQSRTGIVVTVAKWFTPKGNDIQTRGILPNISMTLTSAQISELGRNSRLIGTIADPHYAKAILSLEQAVTSTRPK